MTSFFVEKRTFFSISFHLNPEFENVPLALDSWNFACLGVKHKANHSCIFFIYDLPFSRNTSVTNDDRQTDDNSYNKLDRYSRLKSDKLSLMANSRL